MPIAWDVRFRRMTKHHYPTVIMPPKIAKTPGTTAPAAPATLSFDPTNPFIVQGDRSVLVEVDNPQYAEARDALAPFAELEKSPEHIHTYRISQPVAVERRRRRVHRRPRWSTVLQQYSKFPLPPNLPTDIAETVSRYGRVKLERIDADNLQLVCADKPLLEELARNKKVKEYLGERLDDTSFAIDPAFRGVLKQALITVGYPAEDLAGYTEGAPLPIAAPRHDGPRRAAVPRPRLPARGGRGLPRRRRRPRRLRRHRAALRRGQDHRRHRRHGAAAEEHAGPDHQHHRRQAVAPRDPRQDRPDGRRGGGVHRRDEGDRPGDGGDVPDPHLPAGQDRGLPALQALRPARLGPDHLRRSPPAAGPGVPRHGADPGPPPARADGHADPRGRPRGRRVQLIGPKKYDVPWRELETKGWIAEASCTEVRVALPPTRPAWSTPSPSTGASTASPARTRRRTTSSRTARRATTTSACSSSAST